VNIIFLDIDGVLNTWRFQDYQVKYHECDSWDAQFNFDPICMKNLKELIDKTDSYIVISSTWRNTNNGMNDINNNFKLYGMDKNRIISITPNYPDKSRGYEIEQWLEQFENKDINYIIIDDENVDILTDRLVLCNDYYGLTKNELEKALNLFNI
jgi:hypothetical protein